MGFLSPSVPKPTPPANPASAPITLASPNPTKSAGAAFTPFTMSPAGLKRKGDLNKTSLIGGG